MSIWYIILLIFIIFLLIYYKVKVHIKTFFKKGFLAKRGPYGTRCFYGPQGSGKTLSMVSYLFDNRKKIKIWSNVKLSNELENYTYFNGLEELYSIYCDLRDKKINLEGKTAVIVFDELFTVLQKFNKVPDYLLEMLAQLRKNKIILITSCQSWPDLPLQFRRLTRYAHHCRIITLPFLISLQLVSVEDAENMKWNEIKQTFDAPICWTDLYKCRKQVANCYDTLQSISNN